MFKERGGDQRFFSEILNQSTWNLSQDHVTQYNVNWQFDRSSLIYEPLLNIRYICMVKQMYSKKTSVVVWPKPLEQVVLFFLFLSSLLLLHKAGFFWAIPLNYKRRGKPIIGKSFPFDNALDISLVYSICHISIQIFMWQKFLEAAKCKLIVYPHTHNLDHVISNMLFIEKWKPKTVKDSKKISFVYFLTFLFVNLMIYM